MMYSTQKSVPFDWILVACVSLIVGVSMLELYSLSLTQTAVGNYVLRQGVFVFVSMLVMMLLASIDYRVIRRRHARWLYFGAAALLILVLVIGTSVRGTVGWIVLGPVSLQVVEFVKVAVIIFLASFIAAKQTVFGPGGRLIVSLVLVMFLVGLILLQPDFGSAMIVLSLWFGMLFVSGMRRTHMVIIGIAAVVSASAGWFVLEDYQKDRVIAFVDPYTDPRGSGYNVIQAMVAVGSGGFTGKGLGQGTQAQLGFLPESHTDFIFAVVAEEFGLLGALFLISLFGLMLFRMWRIAMRAPTNFSYLIVSGVMIMLFIQILINVGMNIGLLPVTGIPLPFVSYGGSSLLASTIAVGLVLSIDRVTRRTQQIL